MPRFPIASGGPVPQDQVAPFDSIVSSRGGEVPEFGPVAVQLHVPEIAQRGEVLRLTPEPMVQNFRSCAELA
ncbi:MAG: hypothetical protein CM1200mP35_07120 [Chloroflexota bacterium]|nr:MAG: hypothetical protein CM1200mP35_07120 [Chloroflexota bacterium]